MNRIIRLTITQRIIQIVALATVVGLLAGCATPPSAQTAVSAIDAPKPEAANDHEEEHVDTLDVLPVLSAAALDEGETLRVVATTNIVGDVVREVGGNAIELVQLLPIGADPHSYQARPSDLRELNGAHVIFVNGLHLEEALQSVLDTVDSGAPIVSVNSGVPTIEFDADHTHDQDAADEAASDHHHEGADPHTWMDVHNVEIWVDNVAATLAALDPANAGQYAANADAYRAQLAELQAEIVAAVATIPPEKRKLVTDHSNLAYLANAYGFTVTGTVIPSLSTLASPSAQQLAALQQQIEQENIEAIFVGTTVNPKVAEQIAVDTGAAIVPIYTGSLSDAQGPAATYLAMMRYNIDQIVRALAE
jgi:ABC-type Zn uptake system ZnuABC Zn-binding protein ZnuA